LAQPNKNVNEEFENVQPIGKDEFADIQPIGGEASSTEPSLGERLTSPYDPGAAEFAQKHPIAGPAVRAMSAFGGAVLGAPGALYHAVADPITPQEEQEFAGHTRIPGELTAERLTGAPLVRGMQAYADPKTRPTFGQAMSVLPEALGTGAGTAAAYELGGRAIRGLPSATRAVTGMAPPIARAVSGFVDPELAGVVSPRLGHALRLAERIGKTGMPEVPPKIGATERILVRPSPNVKFGEALPKVGATERIPVRPGVAPSITSAPEMPTTPTGDVIPAQPPAIAPQIPSTGWSPAGGRGGLSLQMSRPSSLPIPSEEYALPPGSAEAEATARSRVASGKKETDVGETARTKEAPRMTAEEIAERRAASRTPEMHKLDQYWRQAREELGEDASGDDIAARVDELAGAPTAVSMPRIAPPIKVLRQPGELLPGDEGYQWKMRRR
jgi:hypothetical protein